MTTTRRLSHIVAGAMMIVAGVAGLSSAASGPAAAAGGDDTHDAMHRMMDAMHGDGTADRIHAVDGGEQLMDDCAEMHDRTGRGGMRGER